MHQLLLEKKSPEKIGLIGHTIINYPNEEDSKKIVEILVQNGADLIELQIPFSEPIADGPVFAKANHEAVARGITIDQSFEFMTEMTRKHSIPFVFMTYLNIVYKKGFDNFVLAAKKAGARGMIIPDLPLDYADNLLEICKAHEFVVVPVLPPNISRLRLEKLQPFFNGFVYAVARLGVTGAKTELDQSIFNFLDLLRYYTELPIALGFGISAGEDVQFLRSHVDYAIVGTQTLRAYEKNGLKAVEELWNELNNAKHG